MLWLVRNWGLRNRLAVMKLGGLSFAAGSGVGMRPSSPSAWNGSAARESDAGAPGWPVPLRAHRHKINRKGPRVVSPGHHFPLVTAASDFPSGTPFPSHVFFPSPQSRPSLMASSRLCLSGFHPKPHLSSYTDYLGAQILGPSDTQLGLILPFL